MSRLLLILILTFIFHTLTKADDISDFQIAGISVGDSLLDYMSKKDIKSSKRNYLKNKKYYVVGYDENLENYTQVDVYLKSGDNKYVVRTISGVLFMNVNIPVKANDILDIQIKSYTTPEHLMLLVKNENNWIQKKEKDEWITKKDKKEWITKKENKEWITKKINKKNDLAYITLLPLAIIIIYIKRAFK